VGSKKGPLEFEQQCGENDRGEGDHDHHREYQHGPAEHRHAVERHARRASPQHPDDDFDRPGNRADLDEADAEEPEVGIDLGAIGDRGQRGVHEPAARRRQSDENRGEEAQAADQIGPEGIGRQARERQVPRGQHLRQQHHAQRLHRGHGEEEHHDRAVHGKELVVEFLWEEILQGRGQLYPHSKRKNAGEQEEKKGGGDVEKANVVVVYDGQQAPALGIIPDPFQLRDFSFGPWAAVRKAPVEIVIEARFGLAACHRIAGAVERRSAHFRCSSQTAIASSSAADSRS
jgi:hypothetical protein